MWFILGWDNDLLDVPNPFVLVKVWFGYGLGMFQYNSNEMKLSKTKRDTSRYCNM
jgi:hypothetical protein